MIGWLRLSRRGWIIAGVAFALALVAFMPLRMVFGVLDLADRGVAARSLRGPVWWGAAEDLRLGRFRIGTVDVMLSPVPLLVGRARIDLSRQKGLPDDIKGAVTVGIATRGIDDVTGQIPMDDAFAPLPLAALNLQDVSIAFDGSRCVRAEGRVRADVTGVLPGLDLSNGLSGEVRCEGADLLIPLVSQSGAQRVDLRLSGDGRYRATMTLGGMDAGSAAALSAMGFRAVDGNQVLNFDGRL